MLNSAAINNCKKINYTLFFANKSYHDLFLIDEIKMLENKVNLKSYFALEENCPNKWNGIVGKLNEDIVKSHLPKPSDETLMMICGIKAVSKEIIYPLLLKCGHKSEDIFIL